LHRAADARNRINAAIDILKQTKDLPAGQIALDSAPFVVSFAEADFQAAEGDPLKATELFEQLLKRVTAANPDSSGDLRDGPRLSHLYEALTFLYQRTGDSKKAEEMKTRRLQLWQGWDRKLSHNRFVLRQIQTATAK